MLPGGGLEPGEKEVGMTAPPKNHLALGDGQIDISERLKLAESRNARCVLETKTVGALKKSVHWLEEKKLSLKMRLLPQVGKAVGSRIYI